MKLVKSDGYFLKIPKDSNGLMLLCEWLSKEFPSKRIEIEMKDDKENNTIDCYIHSIPFSFNARITAIADCMAYINVNI